MLKRLGRKKSSSNYTKVASLDTSSNQSRLTIAGSR